MYRQKNKKKNEHTNKQMDLCTDKQTNIKLSIWIGYSLNKYFLNEYSSTRAIPCFACWALIPPPQPSYFLFVSLVFSDAYLD